MADLNSVLKFSFEILLTVQDNLFRDIFREIFLFHHENVGCVHTLDLPYKGNSNEYSQHIIS